MTAPFTGNGLIFELERRGWVVPDSLCYEALKAQSVLTVSETRLLSTTFDADMLFSDNPCLIWYGDGDAVWRSQQRDYDPSVRGLWAPPDLDYFGNASRYHGLCLGNLGRHRCVIRAPITAPTPTPAPVQPKVESEGDRLMRFFFGNR